MEIIIYSRSLDSLNRDMVNTSSKLFEIDFAISLSEYAKVSIISYEADDKEQFGDVTLIPLSKSLPIVKAISSVVGCENLFQCTKKVIIVFGYEFKILFQLRLVARVLDAKLISYTFDTHKGALIGKNALKNLLVDLYFGIGIKFLNKLDGVILFRKEAYIEMNLKIPFLISSVGYKDSNILPDVYRRKDRGVFRLLYAGTLIEYNSIDVMLKSMFFLEDNIVVLDIYGSGPLEGHVEKVAKNSKNIFYHGTVSNVIVEQAIANADLLINLRDIDNYVSKFAFPSKLIQYLASGIPVLTTRVINDVEFSNAAYIVDTLDPKVIGALIIDILSRPKAQEQKSEYAMKYIREKFQWSTIISDVMKFIQELYSEIGRDNF